MLTIRWDTVVVVLVIALMAVFLIVQVLLRVAMARMIGARRIARYADAQDRPARRPDARRGRSAPTRLTLHHSTDVEHAPASLPPSRKHAS